MKWISHSRQGFSLVEVTLALGIAGFSLLAIFGLLPVGITSHRNALEQTAAAGIATGIFADLRATPNAETTTPNYKITIPNSTRLFLREDGSVDASGGAGSRYIATITFTVPSQSKAATLVHLLITWPAAADLDNNPPKNFSGSFEAVSALDRN